jgi:hypothetical protein
MIVRVVSYMHDFMSRINGTCGNTYQNVLACHACTVPRRDFIFVTLAVSACRENDVEKTNSSSRSFASTSHRCRDRIMIAALPPTTSLCPFTHTLRQDHKPGQPWRTPEVLKVRRPRLLPNMLLLHHLLQARRGIIEGMGVSLVARRRAYRHMIAQNPGSQRPSTAQLRRGTRCRIFYSIDVYVYMLWMFYR